MMDSDFDYPFSEFCDHLAAMNHVQDYQHVERNGEMVELTEEKSFESMVPRVMDYMGQIYPDKQEAFYKGARLMMILNHAASDIQTFEDAGLAVIGGENCPSLIQPKAWKALHHFYHGSLRSEGRTTTEEVIEYARTLPDEEATI